MTDLAVATVPAPVSTSAPVTPVQGRVPLIPMGEMAVALNVSLMPTRAPWSTPVEQIADWVRTGYATLGEFQTWWCDYVARALGFKVASKTATSAQVGIYRCWFPSEVRYDTAIDQADVLYWALPKMAQVRDRTVYLDRGDVIGDGCTYQLPVSERDVHMAARYPDQVKEQLAMTGDALPVRF